MNAFAALAIGGAEATSPGYARRPPVRTPP